MFRASRSWPWRAGSLLAIFVVLAGLTRLVSFPIDILDIDEASYMVGARQWLAGHWPYLSFADNKPPLIYGYYALAEWLSGSGMAGVRLLTNLVTVPLTALAVSAYYRHDRRGIAAGVIYLVYSASYIGSDMLAANCELIMAMPSAWALVCIADEEGARRPGRAFAAGFLLGIATLVKYQAMLWVPAAAIALLMMQGPRRWRSAALSIAALAGGVAVPLTVATLVFWAAGGLNEFIYWNITHNISYVMNPTTSSEVASRVATRLLPFAAVTLPLWVASLHLRSLIASRYNLVLAAGLIGSSLVAAFLGFRFFPHYFVQLYVPLAVAAAPFVAQVVRWPLPPSGAIVVGFSATILAVFTGWNAVRYPGPEQQVTDRAILARVADRLERDECYAGGSLFVWGSAPLLYYDAKLPLASRFFFPEYPLIAHFSGNASATRRHARQPRHGGGRLWKWLITDLSRNKPTFIVDTAPAGLADWQFFPLQDYPWLHRYISRHYDAVDVVDGVRIYRRTGCGDR